MNRLERHGEFISLLEGHRLWGVNGRGAYTDGGPALRRSDRKRRKRAKAARKIGRR